MITDFPAKKIYNPGGYNSFAFAPIQSVTGYSRSISGGIASASVTFADGFDWLAGYATRETLAYTEDTQQDEAGNYYNLVVAGFVPGDKGELEQILADMELQRFIVTIKDPFGVVRIIGSLKQPLSFAAAYNSGSARADLKGFSFKFSGASSIRAPQYAP